MLHGEPFLRESRFCDHRDPSIRELAAAFRAKYPDDRELAVGLFYYVRDGIKYEVGNWQQTAAQTLSRGYGTCTNSANLLVALLRASGIASGYGVMRVRGREYFGPIAPRRLAPLAAEVSKHVYAYTWLGGAWVRCDPSDDATLCAATAHLNPQSQIVEWDGYEHADLNLAPEHIIEDRGPVADIDPYMRRPMRRTLTIPVRIGNLYLEFLRTHGGRFTHPAEAEEAFESWLRAHHPVLHRVFRLFPLGTATEQAGHAATQQSPIP
jgi:hypothetical protein